MEKTLKQWTQSEFLAFLLVYAANADMAITEEECDLICEQFGDEKYNTAKAIFDRQSDYENIQTIMELKDVLFPGSDGKEKILSEMQTVFDADNDFSEIERIYQQSWSKLLA